MLKERAKLLLDRLEPLFKNLEADVGATLNVAAHGSRGLLGASEVKAALERIAALDETWFCPKCRTRIWHRGTPKPDAASAGRARSLLPRAMAGRLSTVIGKQLGHYLLLERLGSGGMGDVFVAHDTRLDRRVALKLPRQDDSSSVDRLGLFRREARAVAALNHPGIVHIYSVEDADGLTFITMELVSGRSLRQLLDAQAPSPSGARSRSPAALPKGWRALTPRECSTAI